MADKSRSCWDKNTDLYSNIMLCRKTCQSIARIDKYIDDFENE